MAVQLQTKKAKVSASCGSCCLAWALFQGLLVSPSPSASQTQQPGFLPQNARVRWVEHLGAVGGVIGLDPPISPRRREPEWEMLLGSGSLGDEDSPLEVGKIQHLDNTFQRSELIFAETQVLFRRF